MKEQNDNLICEGYKPEGYYRQVPTKNEQLQDLIDYKFIYCNYENFMRWIEKENIEMREEYDEYFSILPNEMIPIRICGIKGDEFKDYKGVSEIKLSPNMVKIITDEEQEILLGHQLGEGSDILYS